MARWKTYCHICKQLIINRLKGAIYCIACKDINYINKGRTGARIRMKRIMKIINLLKRKYNTTALNEIYNILKE